MVSPSFDLDVLRTFSLAVELNSFALAADRVARSQSAVSLQMQRLEAQVGQPLFRRRGRHWALTTTGETLLGYTHRLLALHDEAQAAVAELKLAGAVRLGLGADFAESWLPAVLGRFSRCYPGVQLEVRVDRNAALVKQFEAGELDLLLQFGAEVPALAEPLAELSMCWVGTRTTALHAWPTLPLVLFEQPCLFRTVGLAALAAAGQPWRIALTSPSLAGLWAAVQAGLGLTVRSAVGLPAGLRVLPPTTGLPPLPRIQVFLRTAPDPVPVVAQRLREVLLETVTTLLTTEESRQAPGLHLPSFD